MSIYVGSTEITCPYIGDLELEGVYVGDTEIWTNYPLDTYYNYGDASGNENYTIGAFSTLYEAVGLDATPTSKTCGSGHYNHGNCYGSDYYMSTTLPTILKNNATGVVQSFSGERSGWAQISSPDSTLQYNYFFGFSTDEGAGDFGRMQVYYDSAWHSLQQAITDKMIKPLVPICIVTDAGLSSGSLSDIMNDSYCRCNDWSAGFTIVVQANEGVTAVRCWCYWWEKSLGAYWLCVNGRATKTAATYSRSQYKQKWW